jgi:O-antigen/teichoic acid export membrane protein
MSVFARQNIKYSLVGYFGFLVGTLASVFLFPNDMAFYGQLRFVMPAAEMLIPLVVFGLSYACVKFFPEAKAQGKHQNLLLWCLVAVALNFLLVLGLYFALAQVFPSWQRSQLWQMKGFIFPLVLVLSLAQVFNKYNSNYHRIAISNIFESFVPKIANIAAFCLFVYFSVSEMATYAVFLMFFVLSLLGYFWHSYRLERIRLDFSWQFWQENQRYAKIFTYGMFGFLGSIGNYLVVNIDNYMIGEYLDFSQNGVYSTIMSIIYLIRIPAMGLYNLSAPIINQHLADGNYVELKKFHQQSSLKIAGIAMLLLACIVINYPYVLHFIKTKDLLMAQSPVLWVMGVGILFDVMTGFNGHIISLSKHYKFNIVVMLFLAVINITLNYMSLVHWHMGLLGVALSTAVSLFLYNIIKLYFNYKKFGVHPFSVKIGQALLLCSVALALALLCPQSPWWMMDMVLRTAILLLIIFFGNYFWQIFDVSPLWGQLRKMLKK